MKHQKGLEEDMYSDDTLRSGKQTDEQSAQWMKQQLREAIIAGENAIRSLESAREKLSGAKNWGLFDLLGGGVLASIIKHTKMSGAADDMRRASEDLERFQDELQDVHILRNLELETEGFLDFADLFMDSFVADALVQGKIKRAKEQVDEAIAQTGSIVEALRRKYRSM